MKKKGFTLIELLAVIVILAIIALIATPLVLKYIEKSRKESKVDSTYSYVRNLETEMANYSVNNDGTKYNKSGLVEISDFKDIDTTVKGENPTDGKVCLSNLGQVKKGIFEYNKGKYYVLYDGKEGSISDSDTFTDFSCSDSPYGELVQTWDISETSGVDNITMTYYQPEVASSEKETLKEVYEGGTLYIEGTGKMGTGISDYIYDFDVIHDDIVATVDEWMKENYPSWEYELKFTSDDVADLINATGANFKRWNPENPNVITHQSYTSIWKFDPTNPELVKFIPSAIVIDEGVTNVSNSAFSATPVTTVTLPSTLTEIDDRAFRYCTNLKEVVVPDSVTSIGNQAFGNCTGLTKAVLPKSLTAMGFHVFFGDTSLNSVSFNNTVSQWNSIKFAPMIPSNWWNYQVPAKELICTDGTIPLSY